MPQLWDWLLLQNFVVFILPFTVIYPQLHSWELSSHTNSINVILNSHLSSDGLSQCLNIAKMPSPQTSRLKIKHKSFVAESHWTILNKPFWTKEQKKELNAAETVGKLQSPHWHLKASKRIKAMRCHNWEGTISARNHRSMTTFGKLKTSEKTDGARWITCQIFMHLYSLLSSSLQMVFSFIYCLTICITWFLWIDGWMNKIRGVEVADGSMQFLRHLNIIPYFYTFCCCVAINWIAYWWIKEI